MAADPLPPTEPTPYPPAQETAISPAQQSRAWFGAFIIFGVVFVVGFFAFRGSTGKPSKLPEGQSVAASDQQGTKPTDDVAHGDRPFLIATSETTTDTTTVRSSLAPDALFARISPSVVQIVVQDSRGRIVCTGSGFLVGSKGLIATNFHVIEKAHTAHVILSNKTKLTVLGVAAFDKEADIAIIALAKWMVAQPLELAGDKLPPVGVRVYAIGNPLGLANTLSDGLVSGHRELDHSTEIQTTAPISPGSSGGPLLLADGRVVGVMTATVRAGQNLNFAVPASHVASLLITWEAKKRLTQFPLSQQPDAKFYLTRGRTKHTEKEYDKAIEDFTEAIRLAPHMALPYCCRAISWQEKKVYEKAIEDYNQAIRLAPQDHFYLWNRGTAWSAKGDTDKAIKDYTKAIQLDPKVAQYYLNRAFAWLEEQNYDKAIKDFDTILQLDPKNSLARQSRDTALIAQEVQWVAQIKKHLKVGITQKEVAEIVQKSAGKTKSDKVDAYVQDDFVPDFNYVARNVAVAHVSRYFPFESARGNGRNGVAFRLNLLYASGRLQDWYTVEK